MTNLIVGGKEFPKVRNLIFDLGGVIVNIDYQLTIHEFEKLGFENFDEIFGQLHQSHVFDKYDKGLISPSEFRQELRNASHLDISDDAFDKAWNAMILDLPEKRIQLLRNLRKDYTTFLLSNTNEIHLDYFFDFARRTLNITEFSSLFHKAYYSCRMGMRKPDPGIYQRVLNENRLVASETLFIDDTQANLDAAQKIGLQCYCMPKGEDLTNVFSV
jgi:glucose-1-phosphatase